MTFLAGYSGYVRVAGLEMSVSIGQSEGQFYSTEFNSKDYLSLYFTLPKGNLSETGGTHFQLIHLHSFYTKYSSRWNKTKARLLEFGGGPVIISLISAVQYVDQIIFSAYVENERKEIELWKQGKEGAHDWSSHFKSVVNQVEHGTGDWHEREELLRKRITDIIACDIYRDDPLLDKQEPFEIVTTSLCLEAACTASYAQYKKAVKKLVGLLKPGGFLLMFIVERQTFYVVGKKKWPCLYLTLEQVKEALTEAGTTILVAERHPSKMEQIHNPELGDYKALVFVAAQKVEF